MMEKIPQPQTQIIESEDGFVHWALSNPVEKEKLLRNSRATLFEMEKKLARMIKEASDKTKEMLENNMELV